MKKILILINGDVCAYNLRKEVVRRLLLEGYEVYISLPYGEKVELFKQMGCKFIDTQIDNRGTNPLNDFKLFAFYDKLIKRVSPDLVLTYTIKPTIYGGMACRFNGVPYIVNVTGLGTAVENESILQKFIIALYHIALKKVNCVFLQNEENREFFVDHKIALGKHRLIPGSGVNLKEFSLMEYPDDSVVNFLFIGRIMKEKGIDQYLDAAQIIRHKYPNTRFYLLGSYVEDYKEKIEKFQQKGIVTYCGMQADIRPFLKNSHCTIHPTYYPEGMSNVLLETEACGRPIITTNRSGCRETLNDGVNGFLFEPRDTMGLVDRIERFLALPNVEKKKMGLAARAKMEREFDRQIVIDAYLQEIQRIFGREYVTEWVAPQESLSMPGIAAGAPMKK